MYDQDEYFKNDKRTLLERLRDFSPAFLESLEATAKDFQRGNKISLAKMNSLSAQLRHAYFSYLEKSNDPFAADFRKNFNAGVVTRVAPSKRNNWDHFATFPEAIRVKRLNWGDEQDVFNLATLLGLRYTRNEELVGKAPDGAINAYNSAADYNANYAKGINRGHGVHWRSNMGGNQRTLLPEVANGDCMFGMVVEQTLKEMGAVVKPAPKQTINVRPSVQTKPNPAIKKVNIEKAEDKKAYARQAADNGSLVKSIIGKLSDKLLTGRTRVSEEYTKSNEPIPSKGMSFSAMQREMMAPRPMSVVKRQKHNESAVAEILVPRKVKRPTVSLAPKPVLSKVQQERNNHKLALKLHQEESDKLLAEKLQERYTQDFMGIKPIKKSESQLVDSLKESLGLFYNASEQVRPTRGADGDVNGFKISRRAISSEDMKQALSGQMPEASPEAKAIADNLMAGAAAYGSPMFASCSEQSCREAYNRKGAAPETPVSPQRPAITA